MNLHNDSAAFSELLTATAQDTGIVAPFIEKDYWLTTVLRELSMSPYRDMTVFKGGTSLSKGYGIIQRFSEDVDLALIGEGLSGNQMKSRMDSISKSITRHLPEVYLENVTSKGSRFRRTGHVFPILTDKLILPSQAREELVLEINTFANPYPFEEMALSSFISQYLGQLGRADLIQQFALEPFVLQVLKPTRTLAEKVLALARASYHAEPVAQLQENIRHTYDLHFLIQQPEIKVFVESEAFFSMLEAVQAEDANNKEFQGAWAKQPLTAARIYQDDLQLWRQLESVYTGTFKSLVYGPLPSMSEIKQTFSYLAGVLRGFEDRRTKRSFP
ncbi:MAG: nucleotidyl transferase AbiEii/AbiGii toxin family protein [Candidatus Sericytochromatia bacterium]